MRIWWWGLLIFSRRKKSLISFIFPKIATSVQNGIVQEEKLKVKDLNLQFLFSHDSILKKATYVREWTQKHMALRERGEEENIGEETIFYEEKNLFRYSPCRYMKQYLINLLSIVDFEIVPFESLCFVVRHLVYYLILYFFPQ